MTNAYSYPVPSVTLITGAPGGGVDYAARVIAGALTQRLQRPVTVMNVPAATMAEVVAAAPADGATLLMTGKILWMTPYLRKNVSYDPIRDFAPIILAVRSPNILIVNSKLGIAAVADLVAAAKAAPCKLRFTSSGAGSSSYLASELFQNLAGIDIAHVPSVGNVAAVSAVESGAVEFMFSGITAAQRVIKAGTARALAVGSAARSGAFPDLPTMAECAVAGYESESILGIFAPAGTPRPVVDYLNTQLLDCLRDRDVQARLLEANLEAAGTSPEELLAVMKAEMQRLGGMLARS